MHQYNWNWKLYKLCMSVEIVALYGVSLCLLMPSVLSMLVAVVNLVVNKSIDKRTFIAILVSV